MALGAQELFDIPKGVMADVEVSWDPNRFDKALDPASLALFKLLLNSVGDLLSVLFLFFPRLD